MTAQPVPADPPPMTSEQAAQPLTFGALPAIMAGIAPAIRDYLGEAIAPLVARVADLEGQRAPAAGGQAISTLDLDPDLSPVNRALIEGCVAHVKEATAPMTARIEALEQRALAFRGVWRSSAAPYPRGSLASHAGGLWHANSPTSTKPGEDGSWVLIVKRGNAGAGHDVA